MSENYKVRNKDAVYFVTITVIEWIDVFVRNEYREIIIDSLEFCQSRKGLIIHAWVIMTNHLHLIISSNENELPGVMRDFKAYTSRRMKETLGKNVKESRRHWIIGMMEKAGRQKSNNNFWQFWQHGFHPIELWDNYMIDQKLNYLHDNPVRAGFVVNPEDYLFSSAVDYAGGNGMLNIHLLH